MPSRYTNNFIQQLHSWSNNLQEKNVVDNEANIVNSSKNMIAWITQLAPCLLPRLQLHDQLTSIKIIEVQEDCMKTWSICLILAIYPQTAMLTFWVLSVEVSYHRKKPKILMIQLA